MSGVQQRTVGADEAEQRLDRWFRRHFPHVSQGQIEKMCRKGEIRVDGGRVKANTRVGPGAEIRVPPLPDPAAAPPVKRASAISPADEEMIRDTVLFRDDHLLVINKPAGLPTQGGSGVTRHIDMLSEALRFGREDRPRLVHRLDRDTSGVLLLARSQAAASALTRAFRSRETRKIYWAAVAGVPMPQAGTVRYGLVKAPGGGSGEGEKMRTIHPDEVDRTPGAKRATTDYMVLSAAARRCAWLALVPVTGRTHQLRAHMAALGHPIVGDGKYGGSGQENLGDGWGAQLGGEISRKLHLHARSLTLTHPVTQARLTFTAPLPEHMARTWATFDWREADVPADPFEEEA